MRFVHLSFHVRDLERSAAFYGAHFGFRRGPEFRAEDGRLTGLYLYQAPGFFLELFQKDEPRPMDGHFCFEVADVDATVAALRAAGVSVEDARWGRSKSRMAFLADPDGHRIELNAYGHPESWIARFRAEVAEPAAQA